jgi:serine/threonine protein kinase/WD40 repeat protein
MDTDSQEDAEDDQEDVSSEDEFRLSRLLENRGDVTETIAPEGGGGSPTKTTAGDSILGGASLAELPDHSVGEQIGRGGMGLVHRATDAELQRDIALKSLTWKAAGSTTSAARFEREARALAQLEHPNIVPIHRLGHDEAGRPFYTMKLVKGLTLRAILRSIKDGDQKTIAEYPLDRLLTIFRKVCDAVAFAHFKGVVHRDLKPENIMIGEFGEALVMDWGLAKLLDEQADLELSEAVGEVVELPGQLDPSGTIPEAISGISEALTMAGEVVGTPRYMAPEQARGETQHIDARTDVYALGGMLFEILALEPSVSGDSAMDVLKRIAEGDFVTPIEHLKAGPKQGIAPHCPEGQIPPALSAIVMRAMALRREDRYQDVMELAGDIDAWTGGFATSVENIRFVGQLRLLIARHKAITATIAVSLVTVVWATNLYVQGVKREKQIADSERFRARNAEAHAISEATRAREAEGSARLAEADAKNAQAETQKAQQQTEREFAKAQIALAGVAHRDRDVYRMAQLLAACPPEFRDTDWHYLHGTIDETMRTIPSDGVVLESLVGRRGKITGFYGCSTKGLYFILPRKPECRRLDILPKRARINPHSLTLSGNGDVGAVGLYNDRVALFYPRYQRPYRIMKTPKGGFVSMKLDRDGTHLYVTRRGEERIQKLDIKTGQPIWTVNRSHALFRSNPVGRLAVNSDDSLVAVHVMSKDHPILLFDAETGELSHRAEGPQHFLWRIVFSPDGELLAAGDYFGWAHVWEAKTGKPIARFHSGNARLEAMEFTSRGNLVMLSGESIGRTVRSDDDRRWLDIWSPESGLLLKQSLGVPRNTRCLAVDPDRNLVLTGGETIKLWSPPFPPEKIIHHHSFSGGQVGFLGDKLLFAPYDRLPNGCFELQGKEAVPVHRNLKLFSQAVFSADRSVLFCAGQLVTLTNDTKLKTRKAFSSELDLNRAQLNVDGSRLLGLGKKTGSLQVVNTGTGVLRELRHALSGKGVPFVAATFGAENQVIAIRGNSADQAQTDTRLEVWPADTDQPTLSRSSPLGQTTIQSSPDGQLIAVADLGWHVTILAADSLEPVHHFRAHDDLIRDLDFHPRKKILASVSNDMSIKLWDYAVSPPKLIRTVLARIFHGGSRG